MCKVKESSGEEMELVRGLEENMGGLGLAEVGSRGWVSEGETRWKTSEGSTRHFKVQAFGVPRRGRHRALEKPRTLCLPAPPTMLTHVHG